MNRLKIALVIVLLGPALLGAKTPLPKSSRTVEARGYFLLGGQVLGLADLNARLRSEGYASFSRAAMMIGGGGYALINGRLLLGGEGFSAGRKETSGAGTPAVITGSAGFFNLGCAVVHSAAWRMTLLGGIGGGSLTLKVRGGAAAEFAKILRDQGEEVKLTKSGMLFKTGVLVESFLNWGKGGVHKRGLLVGLSAGYVAKPNAADWRMDGTLIADGPSLRLSGPYLNLVLGIGGGSVR